ncbi:deoxyxylulose-5-phosphate synthase [Streptomyces sp. TP-A0874]|uniref:deoxyxylulose-5-phosphate synthase n=1 Tax=Streptomyces sp. TP-A0874 TaxID=549819 RepID=UPI0008528F6B|nr:deoxyxylulose-5-phosphate synthase [Streptomyces sp. TP-A0874]
MFGHAKTSFVCLPCRARYKQPFPAPGEQNGKRRCPRCREDLIHVGSAFEAPRRRDTEGWRVLSVLLNAGIRFHRSCCGGPGYRPRTLHEVKARLAHAEATGEPVAEALLRPELP